MTREIPLSRGFVTVVDDEDYERFCHLKWSATCNRPTAPTYAVRYWREGARVRAIGLHRAILAAPPEFHVDHINGDGLDNRRSNIRLCTRAQNAANQRKHRHGRSPYRCVIWVSDRECWRAVVGGKIFGEFKSELKAALVADEAMKRLYPGFARLNFPEPDA